MGVAADLDLHPTAAMAAGFLAGTVSVLGYHYLTPYLSQKYGIQDICGVHNLHGMPGVMSCIVGIFATLHAAYDHSKYPENTNPDPVTGKIIDAYNFDKNQALWQFISMCITLGLAISGGIITGFISKKTKSLRPIIAKHLFNDRTFWNLPTDYEHVINAPTTETEKVDVVDVVVESNPKKSKKKAPTFMGAPKKKIEEVFQPDPDPDSDETDESEQPKQQQQQQHQQQQVESDESVSSEEDSSSEEN